MEKRFYEIKVYEGMDLLFECEVPVGHIGDRQLDNLLQMLVVKHGLTPEEIVDGHLNRNAGGYHQLPAVHRDVRAHQRMCGDGIHAVMRVVEH